MKKQVFIISAIMLIVASSGCVGQSPVADHTNATTFAEKINASQNYYDDMVTSDPTNATAWLLRGLYYNDASGQYEEALRSLNRSLELDPGNGDAWYAKGIILQNMQRFNGSEIWFQHAGNHSIPEKT
ncbi:MAG: tetratricopeptide repeat protein [Methanoregula sp.]|nr:tetratricopeptide repeat protein [Methanoregula sp.]